MPGTCLACHPAPSSLSMERSVSMPQATAVPLPAAALLTTPPATGTTPTSERGTTGIATAAPSMSSPGSSCARQLRRQQQQRPTQHKEIAPSPDTFAAAACMKRSISPPVCCSSPQVLSPTAGSAVVAKSRRPQPKARRSLDSLRYQSPLARGLLSIKVPHHPGTYESYASAAAPAVAAEAHRQLAAAGGGNASMVSVACVPGCVQLLVFSTELRDAGSLGGGQGGKRDMDSAMLTALPDADQLGGPVALQEGGHVWEQGVGDAASGTTHPTPITSPVRLVCLDPPCLTTTTSAGEGDSSSTTTTLTATLHAAAPTRVRAALLGPQGQLVWEEVLQLRAGVQAIDIDAAAGLQAALPAVNGCRAAAGADPATPS
uniref:Uncharacterized protein n=1 Tax=Chlamydomonas leiostraca TaxID=1034604 RepID=A0A7S0X031_9CHLO|mmetsp:Transcript_5768/g.14325  ORF Transcript_5768/g.14325 Transcript_5768/m.14325 type:complete len:374 (+) Transcript_5768:675-1796(+)